MLAHYYIDCCYLHMYMMQAQREIPSKSKTKLHPVPRLATSQAELRGAFNFVNIANIYVDSTKCSYYKK